ncbi:Thiol-specific monooxygenase [Wickerhamomyces ciferrii]|uniref:Thiol-specific monooxygenase n=1 Tax=Wickerhamomyces ciferrii (strain ATCC 14091 / BCRC 22168 / CBS 111 / JCM 3599 / NBRC 0793 / NRRL Y-1031 F-60-10) TaxID=1206466 RepID=K0KW10_WICCF|nr:Thiol-specific monooxygenase [Wickerhamomyces ciferrii]CCH45689.1 Thiol-specific monooxygenase [Wickerhamomyces ciferrii]
MRTTLILRSKIKDIAVIGGGPCGAGLTKALLAENSFSKVKVYERRHKLGGLWNYTGLKSKCDNVVSVPSTDPRRTIQKLKYGDKKFFESPVYKYLDANVPKDLMAYKDHPFGDDIPLFPRHEQILKYIENYSESIKDQVSFEEEVTSVSFDKEQQKWNVISKSLNTNVETKEVYDAVAIATGSYDQPMIPNVPGISEWSKQFPNSILHAKNYDEPAQFQNDKTILVVGNSASGADIAYQLATHLDKIIYKSVRSENPLPAGKDERIKDVPDLLRFEPETKTIHFKDGSSLKNVDKVIFATGYLKSIPFIKDEPLITDGQKVHGLYKHLIYYNNPTLAVIGLPRFVLPTRLSETQGCWLARVWSGRLSLPSREEMIEFDKSIEAPEDRKYHDLDFPKDVEYSNELNNQVNSALGDYGYFAVHWDEEQTRIRSAIKQIKEGYIKYMADKGKPAYSLKELEEQGYFEYPASNK